MQTSHLSWSIKESKVWSMPLLKVMKRIEQEDWAKIGIDPLVVLFPFAIICIPSHSFASFASLKINVQTANVKD